MSLRLYLDENVDTSLVELLRMIGIDTVCALEAGMAHQRIPDRDQLAFAASVGRAICSYNIKDYSPLAVTWANDGRDHAGIVLMHRRPLAEMVARFRALAERYPDGMTNVCDWL